MSKNPETYIFTEETLKEHDLKIAAKVHQASVASTIRQMNKLNTGQQLRASRNNGRDLYWSNDKLERVLAHINDED